MALCVCAGATLQCSFGVAPSALAVLPANGTMTSGAPAATIADCAPIVNVPPFAMCTSMSNPTVIALTAAALGVPTPAPCIPVPAGTWMPGAPALLIGGVPALTADSKLMCAWGGAIQILMPGQATVSK
ncbi:DUF4280 domain-containing protein [Pseudoduganella buxea]|uniref:DUF4280 domain-containing protein n=1 Tax=Pseudoduganella buxea TaxID=1949069 RepID=A0A6I3T4K1_9BURK|nr:DUF4280 domain-containing protein [Pseudoduganella buxea]MTV56349.1 DUF4280 domain-containing protein [Pseudoduganella buxea]GGC13557.1 hypothetical protein GCM10011572_38690 [Pseudoduganella buxea]